MLTARVLNRTLLQRQHLLERVDQPPLALVEHLLGLQAQDVLPPYLSLFARLRDFDPEDLSRALETRAAVRVTLMRGTIHLVTAADALTLRPFVQQYLTRVVRSASWGRGFTEERYAELVEQVGKALAAGPLPARALGQQLAGHVDRSPSDAVNLAKALTPLVQLPPRGQWSRSGGQVYQTLETWVGAPLAEPDRKDIVRRYLRAFGPASPADVTTWSGVTGMKEVFERLGDELVRHEGPDGKPVFDLAGLPVASGEEPAPVRLLGTYDNLWLSHAGRDRVTDPETRGRWMGANGGLTHTVFADGRLAGGWRRTASGKVDLELYRRLTRAERTDLAAEVAAVEGFLQPSR